MIFRGTTPVHIFGFPFEQEEVEVLYISYFQKGEIRVNKTLSDVTFDPPNQTIEVKLSQKDTLSFAKYKWLDKARDSMILIQIRTKLTNGDCYVSEPIKERLGDVLYDGEI